MRTITFLQDFATKKEGETHSLDGQIARNLVNRGVASYAAESSEIVLEPADAIIEPSAKKDPVEGDKTQKEEAPKNNISKKKNKKNEKNT